MQYNNPIAFRADEGTKAEWAKFCEQFPNKGVALQALLDAYEASNAGEKLPGSKDVTSDFESTLHSLHTAFIGQLERNVNTEYTVHQKYADKVEGLEKALQDYQKRTQQARETAEKALQELDMTKARQMQRVVRQSKILLMLMNVQTVSKKTVQTV